MIVRMHGYSHTKAIISTFPHLDLRMDLFGKTKWKDLEEQRAFFEQLAYDKGFHPTHEVHRWYIDVSRDDVEARTVKHCTRIQ